jgi:hypothetical protein
MTLAGPEPGWYFDPDGGDHERFWNGEAWTEHRRLKPLTANPSQPSTANPAVAATSPQQRRKSGAARQVIPHDRLGVLTKIGQGGQGVVYRAPNVKAKFASSMVYKEYKTQARADINFTALAAMPTLVEESLPYAQAERLIAIAAWPCAIVEDAGIPTGFVMGFIDPE